jgi:glycosyl transferase family 25
MDSIQTLVISLRQSSQRRALAQATLDDSNLKWGFIDAVDGASLQEDSILYDQKKVPKLLGFGLTNTEIGCFISHRNAWLKCVASNQAALIFEDDFIIEPHFQESLNILLTQYIDWDIARLQGLRDSQHQLIKKYGCNEVVINKTDPLGATAYLIKPRSAEILLANSKKIFEPLDHFLEHRKKHGLRIVAIKPYPVTTRNLPTTITGRPSRPPITGLQKLLRSLLRWVDRIINSEDPWFPK